MSSIGGAGCEGPRKSAIESAPLDRGERWCWPQPPLAWRHEQAPAQGVAQPCRIETVNGAVVEGELTDIDPRAGRLMFRSSAGRTACRVALERVRRLTLTTPLRRAPPEGGAPVEQVPADAEECNYCLKAHDGSAPLTGRTVGHVEADEGLYLFAPLNEKRALRVFVPRSAYALAVFGPKAQHLAAARWIGTPQELVRALDRQQRMPVLPIGHALLNLGFLTQRQLELALAHKAPDVPLGESLVSKGMITRGQLQTALAHKMGYPLVDLTRFPIDRSLVGKIPIRLAAQCFALPLMIHKGCLIVAVDRPSRTTELHSLKAFAGLKLVPVLASKTQIMFALGELARQHFWPDYAFAGLVFAPTTL